MEPTSSWYIAEDGQPIGPFPLEELLARARDGRLRPQQLVWQPEFGAEWRPAGTVQGLAAVFPAESRARAGTAGTTPNGEITRAARAALAGHWAEMVGITLLWIVIAAVVQGIGAVLEMAQPPVGSIAAFVLGVPFTLGWLRVLLNVADGRPARAADLFGGFVRWGAGLAAQLLVSVFLMLWSAAIVFLVGLLAALIFPALGAGFDPAGWRAAHGVVLAVVGGVIVAALLAVSLRYVLTLLVIADDASVGALQAVRRSVQLMRGRKWKFVRFVFRFFGWALLSLLSCGIGFLFLMPYAGVAMALWYRDALPPET
ncbi:MAG: DUF975 family protein [Kiritimatiellae bacterium]|nr:DUF975 family protein [Kiritimatiellia bacterium]